MNATWITKTRANELGEKYVDFSCSFSLFRKPEEKHFYCIFLKDPMYEMYLNKAYNA